MNQSNFKPILFAVLIVVALGVITALKPFTTIPAGYVGVTSLFGKVDADELPEGFHLINPLRKVERIDCKNKELTLEGVSVPSQDQLTTMIDITVKWRVNRSMAAEAFKETGDAQALKQTHLIPEFRSLIREAGKAVIRAEDFYQSEVQSNMQSRILDGLQTIKDKGILVDAVLMRRVELPAAVTQGVLDKKRQEQKAEQQKAEFERFKTEQQQKVASAEAERAAAVQQAEQRKALADAKAYEITAEAKARAEAIRIEGEAIQNNPDLIRLRAVEKWSGAVPSVTLGGGGGNGQSGSPAIMPFLDITPAELSGQ